MSNLEELADLHKRLKKLQKDAHKAEGAFDAAKKKLLDKYGCRSIRSAEKLLKKLTREEKQATKDLDEALENFKTEWSEFLD